MAQCQSESFSGVQNGDLRRFGERLARSGAARGKKQAVVAVARKLAVLMHHLWAKEDTYDPLYNSGSQERRIA